MAVWGQEAGRSLGLTELSWDRLSWQTVTCTSALPRSPRPPSAATRFPSRNLAVSCLLTLWEEAQSACLGQSHWISRAQNRTRGSSGSGGLLGRGQPGSRLLSLDLVDILSRIVLVVWGCPVHGWVFRGFPGLCPTGDNRQVSPGGQSPPSFRATAVPLLTLISFLLSATFMVRPL